jgi:universal stress protein A
VIRAVVDGSPKVEIIQYARKQNIDLIVLSTHGRTGLTHVLVGSVAETVVRTAPCPVLTVRPETHRF